MLVVDDGTVTIRPPELDDFAAWSALRAESREFLAPWEPIWPTDDLTQTAFRNRIRRYGDEIGRDEAYPFFVFDQGGKRLVGGLTLGNIRRGAAQAGTLGYWMGARHARQGLMTRAVRLACKLGFLRLGLRRIEAACLPENVASIRLLEKSGFRQEGRARAYLAIAGVRRDHITFALLDDEMPA
ncbi:MAG TPA: GNAT family protein [Beijerinckiaceae bacterium]|nr:GNAT family protein [Beijerinckiaceae bacterium]